jgi:hypothetical protein
MTSIFTDHRQCAENRAARLLVAGSPPRRTDVLSTADGFNELVCDQSCSFQCTGHTLAGIRHLIWGQRADVDVDGVGNVRSGYGADASAIRLPSSCCKGF